MTDKRSEGQFNLIKPVQPIPTGKGVPDITLGFLVDGKDNKAHMEDKPARFVGGAGARMKALSSMGREEPDSVVKVGENNPIWAGNKPGRSAIAEQLGLPNKKEFRAKKKKG
jgi:hypothetical protein